MHSIKKLILDLIDEDEFLECNFSSPRLKSSEVASVHIKKTASNFKIEYRLTKHNNIEDFSVLKLKNKLDEFLTSFKQSMIRSHQTEYQALLNKKLKAHITQRPFTAKNTNNRVKNYIIPENTPCDFLIEIGVMTSQGKVKSSSYKKFKQINHFLELVHHMFKDFNKDLINVVDFGCGKSYLTFALHHYFTQHLKIKTHIIGLDLKNDVVKKCNQIALKIKAQGLKFQTGFIHDYQTKENIDFVASLHACDTATDDAILFSLEHSVQQMMFVPCCQHELNSQIKNKDSESLLKHGLLREKMTSLVTDSMRSQLIRSCGYKSDIIEFIDTEHTPKNIMIRCLKTNKSESQSKKDYQEYLNFKSQWQINPYLEKEMIKRNFITGT